MFEQEKSTRDLLAELYLASLGEIEERIRLMETPAELLKKEEKSRLFKDAKELIGLKILNEDITKEYLGLEESIAEKSAEIKKLYGIEPTENSLSAIRTAFENINKQLEEELIENEAEFKALLEKLKEEAMDKREDVQSKAEEKIGELDEKLKELTEKSKVELEREASEFDYNLRRERKAAKEKREQLVSERKAALKLKEQEARERKEALEARLGEIEALQEEVMGIPDKIEAARKDGAAEREKRLNREHRYREELDNKTEELRMDALQTEYDRLLNKYEALKAETEELSKRLDQCNMESRKLTSDTVRFIGGINILNPDTRQYSDTAPKNK